MGSTERDAAARRLFLRPLAAALLTALAALPGSLVAAEAPAQPGATLPVTSCADDGSAGTLRVVAASAGSGDTIDLTALTCGTIVLANGQIETTAAPLAIAGPGRDLLTIDANHASRVFFHAGSSTLTISGLTLANGRSDAAVPANPPGLDGRGGCVYSRVLSGTTGQVAFVDSRVTGCEAVNHTGASYGPVGGAVYVRAPASATNTIFADNTVDGTAPSGTTSLFAGGGGIFAAGAIAVNGSTFTNNRALSGDGSGAVGGAMYAFFGGLSAVNSVIDGNFAGCDTTLYSCNAAAAGGLGVEGYGATLSLSATTVTHNRVSSTGKSLGGGFATFAGGAFHQFADSLISENEAYSTSGQAWGGGMYLFGGYPKSARSTISGNTADVGGGIFVHYANFILDDSTVSGNTAVNAGGIYNDHVSGYYGGNGPLFVRNSTVTANVATGAAAVGGVAGGILDTQTQAPSTFLSSIIANNSAPNADVARADAIGFRGSVNGANNIVIAAGGTTMPADTIVADPLLGPLQENGGPTPTHALLPNSPALDAGNNTTNFATDQRGLARVVGVAADIGAFETQQPFTLPLVAIAFAPDTINRNGTSTLTITLTNDNDVAATLTADFVDALPESLVIADPANEATTCGNATVVADPGESSVTLGSGAGIGSVDSCTVSVSVTAHASDAYTNTIAAGALETDLGANADPASGVLTVVNTTPTPANDSYTTTEGSALNVSAPGLLGNDSDPDGDALTALLAVAPAHGTLALNADGSFTYTPAAGYSGTDTFTYLANDGEASAAAIVTITIKDVNQAPTAVNDAYSTSENVVLAISAPGVLSNDDDSDGDTLLASVVAGPANGTLALNGNGGFTYTPAEDFVGADSFTYKATDGQLDSGAATVTITVTQGAAEEIFASGFE